MNHIYLSLGEDVHKGETGIADKYQGSTSQFAPEDDFIFLQRLRQVDPAHEDRDFCTGWWKFWWMLNGALFLWKKIYI